MMYKQCLLAAAGTMLSAPAMATVHFKETFPADWESRWVSSTAKGDEAGPFGHSAGRFFNDEEEDKGIKTLEDGKFYGISAKFDSFSNKDKNLVLQYSVKHEQGIDCGGGYLKLFPSTLEQKDMDGDSEYHIMFGPDICGSTKRTHAIFNYKGNNHLKKKDAECKKDVLTHLYTFVVKPDNTYQMFIDKEEIASGSMEDDFPMLPDREIPDPDEKKPEDWDERRMIDDPDAKKPEGYDEIPDKIVDPDAEMPDDWDEEEDGEWEAPTVPNPEFKGPWQQPQISNPDYKGKWEAKKIPNPEYTEDKSLYHYADIGAVGFDLWQVKSGSIFDNVLIGDDLEEAFAFADLTFGKLSPVEAKLLKEDEEAAKAAEEEDSDDDDEDDDDKEEL